MQADHPTAVCWSWYPEGAIEIKGSESPLGKFFTEYTFENAVRLGNELAAHIDERVVLFGGGGASWQSCRLEDVMVRLPVNRQKNTICTDSYEVEILLEAEQGERFFRESRTFHPHYGSWKIAYFTDERKNWWRNEADGSPKKIWSCLKCECEARDGVGNEAYIGKPKVCKWCGNKSFELVDREEWFARADKPTCKKAKRRRKLDGRGLSDLA